MTPAADDILMRLSSLHELRLRVGADHDLGCIEIEVDGLASGHSCIMAPHRALDLALRLTAACARLRKVEIDQPPPGSAGPFSARF